MTAQEFRDIFYNGLWKQNAGIVQLLGLYLVLGIFIPLIVTNCIILARAESFASKNSVLASALDGVAMGLGLTAVLVVLGGIRESFGHGTLLSGVEQEFRGS